MNTCGTCTKPVDGICPVTRTAMDADHTGCNEWQPILHPCPCEHGVSCSMEHPCFGCETYGEWVNEQKGEG